MQEKYSGTVVKGDERGRQLGYPTANIDISNLEINIEPGVYDTQVNLLNSPKTYQAILFFGPKKTFDQIKNTLEVYILNFDQDIYGETLEFTIDKFIRGPIKFNSMDELVEQIKTDLSQLSPQKNN